MKYTAVFEKDPGGAWLVEVPEVPGCHTFGRNLPQARRRIRQALAMWLEKDEADLDIVEQPKLDDRLESLVQETLRLRREAEEATRLSAERTTEAVSALVKSGFPLRDAGSLIGISYQRVGQLVGAKGVVKRPAQSAAKRPPAQRREKVSS